MKLHVQLLIIAFLLTGSSFAGDLKWEQNTIEVKTAKGQQKVEFNFINTFCAPVKIQSVQTSCGCTTAQMPKKEPQPDESSTLTVIFAPSTAGKVPNVSDPNSGPKFSGRGVKCPF